MAPQQLAGRQAATGSTVAYVAPFAVYVGLMAIEHALGVPILWGYVLRCLASLAAILYFSRGVLSLRPSRFLLSVLMGVAVFLVWIGPDVLFGYRHHWLFSNFIVGQPVTGLPAEVRNRSLFLVLRLAGSALLVPILEELFWRGWMMRWLIDNDFLKVPLGTYAATAFWVVAVLFAAEHGPFWEVGLGAGILYNWWLTRTRNLADCILAHAITNAVLGAYVLATGHWEYWL